MKVPPPKCRRPRRVSPHFLPYYTFMQQYFVGKGGWGWGGGGGGEKEREGGCGEREITRETIIISTYNVQFVTRNFKSNRSDL